MKVACSASVGQESKPPAKAGFRVIWILFVRKKEGSSVSQISLSLIQQNSEGRWYRSAFDDLALLT